MHHAQEARVTGVYTRSYSNYRDGCQTNEQKLTSEYVRANGVSVLRVLQLDDPRGTEGQVLVADGVLLRDGLKHDLILAADMSGRAYAWDAWSGRELWKQSLAHPVTITKDWDYWGINSYWSILSTGVIDPGTNTWYLVALSSADGTMAKAAYWFHAISLVDGSAKFPPMLMSDASYTAPSGSVKRLGSAPRKQRAALTLVNKGGRKFVYVPFSSFLESAGTNMGFVVAVEVTNAPRIDATWATGDKYIGPGIWMAGAGLSVSDDGDLIGMTGNGGFDPPSSVGECIFRLQHTPGELKLVDWWSPFSDAGRAGDDPTAPTAVKEQPDDMGMMDMDGMKMPMPTNAINAKPSNIRKVGDQDLGSGGALYLPASLYGLNDDDVWGGGKDGILYSVKAKNMGKTMPADLAPDRIAGNYGKLNCPPYGFTWYPSDLDIAPTQLDTLPWNNDGYTHHVHGQPVAYISSDHGPLAYVHGENSPVRAFKINPDGSPTYLACGQEVASQGMKPPGGMPGGMLTLSCVGQKTNTGVLWSAMPWYGDANKTITPGRLVSYGSNWVDQNGHLIKLWDSADWGWNYMHSKFTPPTVWNGLVLLPSYDGRILVIG